MKQLISAITLTAITVTGIYLYPSISALPDANPNPPTTLAKNLKRPISNVAQITDPAAIAEQNSNIEVAFVLDTTGSMSSLIQSAKDNVWSIASSMASAESAPTIKMGLVAYRDRGDDYVTKISDLNEDIDTGYGTLMSLRAAGGGDAPESVNKALYDAVTKMSWSQDDNTYRVIFLVGDAAPKMSYQDEMKYPEIIELAKQKGIIINTIQCGQQRSTTGPWKHIASLSQGKFFQVEQSGGAVAVATPYDEQIASLSKELDGTRVFYGNNKTLKKKLAKQAASERFNRSASPASVARKAEFNISKSGSRNFSGDNELVADLAIGKVDLNDIVESELPIEVRELKKEDRQRMLKEKAVKRDDLTKQIAELSSKRQDFVRKELAKTGEAENSLDNRIYQTVKSQAKDKGLVYSDDSGKY